MARQHHEAGETLLELQSFADHAGEWLREHWLYPAAVVLGLVLLTGVLAGVRSWREHRELVAADAVAAADREFLASMGASPGAYTFEEPANPETAKKARRDAADRFLALAKEYRGTGAGVEAQIQAGALLAHAGNTDQALEIWQAALGSGTASPELQALIHMRIGQAEEAAGRWEEAAKAYQAAGEQRAFPLWSWALADAARCLVEAGHRDQAVRIAERLRTDASASELPPHLAALLEELRQGPRAAPPS